VGRSDQRPSDYLVSWLAWKRPRVSGRTWERYSSLLKGSVIPALGHLQLQDLTSQHLDEFYATCLLNEPGQRKHSKLSATTVHHRHVALKMALKRAVEQGILIKNPADFTSPPRPGRPQMRVLNEAEVAPLLGALEGTPAELVGYLGLMTGARLGELLALRWCDLDLEAQVMYVRQTLVENMSGTDAERWYSFKEPKSGKGRPVDLDAGTVAKLRSHHKAQSETRLQLGLAWTDLDVVITNAFGAPVRPSTVLTQFRTVAHSLGFERLRFHDTRHTHATILLKNGVAPKGIRNLTCGFQEGPVSLAERRIVAGQTACVVPVGTA
jgi:integrase